jgi:hypothetical protein
MPQIFADLETPTRERSQISRLSYFVGKDKVDEYYLTVMNHDTHQSLCFSRPNMTREIILER